MRIALDSNFLLYAEGINDVRHRDIARSIMARLPFMDTCVPVQALGEVFRVLTGKAGISASAARATVLNLSDVYRTLETTEPVLLAAMDLAVDHQLTIWDAIILSCAAEAGCRVLLSEDMQDGFTWRGVSVINPFLPQPHPLLDTLLQPPRPD